MKISAIIVMITVLFSWYGYGFYLAKLIKFRQKRFLDTIFVLMFGFGVIGNIITILGIFQLLNNISIGFAVTAGTILAITTIFNVKPKIKFDISNYFHDPFFITSLIFLFLYSILTLLPPTGIDGLMYHLSVPKLYLQNGGFFDIPWNVQSDLPMLGEMNFIIGVAAKNPVVCRMIAFLSSIFACGGLIIVSDKVLRKSYFRFIPLLIFVSHPTSIGNFAQCDVDLLTAAFTIAAFALLPNLPKVTISSIIPSSIMLGYTLQSKPFGLFVLPVLLFLLIIDMHKGKKINLVVLFVYVSIPLIAGSIWYIKALVFTGEPIVKLVASFSNNSMVLTQIITKIWLLLSNIAIAPWSYSLAHVIHRMGNFGPIFISIIPFIFIIRKKDHYVIRICVYAIMLMGTFLLLSTWLNSRGGLSVRYMFASIILFSIVTGYIVSAINTLILRRFLLMAISFAVVINLSVTIKRFRYELGDVFSGIDGYEYLRKEYPLYRSIEKINIDGNNSDTVIATHCFGTFYLDIPYIVAKREFKSRKDLDSFCKQNGISYLLANNVLFPYQNKYAWFNGDGFIKLSTDDDYRSYRIKRDNNEYF